MGELLSSNITRFDVQILNEQGAPIDMYQIPKYDFKKSLDKIIDSIEKGEVYAINIRKAIKLIS
jgi:hypothetical protein